MDDFTALFLVCVCVCVCVCIVLRLYVKYPTAILPFMNACCAYVDDLPAGFSSSMCKCVRVRARTQVYVCVHACARACECFAIGGRPTGQRLTITLTGIFHVSQH